MPRPGLAALALLAVLAAPWLAGCASGGANAAPVATSTVDLPPSYRFAPAAITVAAGTTVTWTNHDNFTHSMQLLDGGLPGEPHVMPPGTSASVTFTTPGVYHYQCHLHPTDMKGTVTVTS